MESIRHVFGTQEPACPDHAQGGHALEHGKMVVELGVAASTVMRHWHARGPKPHIVRGFKISHDPKFAEKLEDILGL